MKKKILCISMFSALSFGIQAETDNQAELESILLSLSSDKLTVAQPVKKEIKKRNNMPSKKGYDTKEIVTNNGIETVYIKNEAYVRKNVNDNHKVKLEMNNNDDEKIVITNLEKQFNKQQEFKSELSNHDHVYLLNVPINTKIYAAKDIFLYPYRDGLIYDDGKLKSSSPLKFSDDTTYCYLAVEKSGSTRRFKKETEGLTITGNNSYKMTYRSNLEPDKQIEMYETTFTVDNPHIKGIKCLSTEKDMPLKLSDLNFETGNIFRIEFPPVVDIF
jgi:hypothetical protein